MRRPTFPVIRCLALLVLLMGLHLGAGAQVVRCTDPATGKVTYTDGECGQGQNRREVVPRQTPEEIQLQYEQAQAALRLQREQQQKEREAQVQREAAVAAARPAVPAAEVNAFDPAQSVQCAQAKAALQGALSLDPGYYDTNARIAAAQENVDIACLTPAEYASLQKRLANRSVHAAPAYPPAVIVVPPIRPHRPQHRTERPRKPAPPCQTLRCPDK